MPPQQTNLISEARREAAGLSLDLSIALVKDGTGDPSAAARADASLVALREASFEKEAAEPPAPSTRNVLSLLKGYWRAFQERRQRERSRGSLYDLSERALMDIGLTPGDIDYIVAHRAFERLRDGTTYLWWSRGVM
jgi:uncharacterized protein YjiS (DUF1127 family)